MSLRIPSPLHAASLTLLCVGAALLAGCQRTEPTPATAPPAPAAASAPAGIYTTAFSRTPGAAAMTALGRQMFFDAGLSASGRLSCASCHDPQRAYGPPNALAVQLGGADGRQPGVRAVPALRYLEKAPPFAEHRFDEAIDESVDQGPSGGHTWDGRADTVHDQAKLPLLSPFEMANADEAAVVDKVRRAAYAPELRAAFGDDVLDKPLLALRAVLLSLETFQQSPKDFYPYDSRYDRWLRTQQGLDERELRGLAAFNDPRKGNCASCHPSAVRHGAFPQFTDFGLIAIGVPRNRAIPANADPAYHDLGLCGPLRTDFKDKPEYCGLFRAPSLRNVALRQRFFHNGAFTSLEDVVRFYATRDTQPARWYPKDAKGRVQKFDDLPAAHQANLNRDPPFDRQPGQRPALNEREIRDIVAFLKTLTDADLAEAPRH